MLFHTENICVENYNVSNVSQILCIGDMCIAIVILALGR